MGGEGEGGWKKGGMGKGGADGRKEGWGRGGRDEGGKSDYSNQQRGRIMAETHTTDDHARSETCRYLPSSKPSTSSESERQS